MKNIALITDISFWEVGNGQNARIWQLFTFLNHHSKLTLYYLGGETLPYSGQIIREEDKKHHLAAYLEQALHDVVIIEKIHLSWVADLKLKRGVFYLDAHDLIFERGLQFQKFNRPYSSLSFQEELAIYRKFDKVIFLQNEEIEKMEPHLGVDRLLLCPHPVVPEENIVLQEEVKTISFLGGPSWPNIDSIQWFHDWVLPLLGNLAQKCVIHGAINYSPFYAFSPHLAKGHLFPSLKSYYSTIDIAINPSLYGSGLKIKTVEALAYGIPLVTTSIGAEGLGQESGLSFLLADTPEDFAAAICELVSSLALRHQLSSRAKAFAQQHFTPHTCFKALLV